MAKRTKRPRNKRYLLTAAALSAGTMMLGCGSRQGSGNDYEPMPGNPKGSVYPDDVYEDAAPTPENTAPIDAGVPDPPPDAGEPEYVPLPGNPKGSLYVDDVFSGDE